MQKLNALIIGASIALGPAAVAQNATPPAQQPRAQQQVEVTDQKLEKFAEIYVDVESTRSRLAEELANAEDQGKAQELQMKMRDEIIGAIEDHGWSLQQYNRVAQTIARDQELKEKALEKINGLST